MKNGIISIAACLLLAGCDTYSGSDLRAGTTADVRLAPAPRDASCRNYAEQTAANWRRDYADFDDWPAGISQERQAYRIAYQRCLEGRLN